MQSEEQSAPEAMPLTDHLSELRDRLVRSLLAVAVFSIAAAFFTNDILMTLSRPIEGKLGDGALIYTGPMDMFFVKLKIAVATGITLACPVWLYQIWRFVAPGLYAKEKKYGAAFIICGAGLFLTGVMFAYFLILPTGLGFLLEMQPDAATSKIRAMIDITKYMNFLTTTVLVFGAAFELPLVLTLLGLMGVIDQRFLREKRRFAIVGMATVSAVVTPPDALSMILLLVPLCLLYELSVFTVGFMSRSKLPATVDADPHQGS